MKTLYIVRHGETDWNKMGKYPPKLSSRKRLSTVIGIVRSPRMTSAVTKARLKSSYYSR